MRKTGFTLAEVLITLVIIGVIAAMTVPTLMNNTNANEMRSALKKAISGANQALVLNYAMEGVSAADYSTAEELVENVFSKRMNILSGGGEEEHDFGGLCGSSVSSKFTTTDGIMFCLKNFASGPRDEDGEGVCNANNTSVCGAEDGPQLIIDVNGVKKPNKLTTNASRPRDIYQASIYSQRVVPYGNATQAVMMDAMKSQGTSGSEDVTGGTEPSDPSDGPYEGPEPGASGGDEGNDESEGDPDDPYYDPKEDYVPEPEDPVRSEEPEDIEDGPYEGPEPLVPPGSSGSDPVDPFDDDGPAEIVEETIPEV